MGQSIIDLDNVSGAVALDASRGSFFKMTLVGNVVFGLNNVKPSQTCIVMVTQDGTGGWTTDWTGGSQSVNGTGAELSADPAPGSTTFFTIVGSSTDQSSASVSSNSSSSGAGGSGIVFRPGAPSTGPFVATWAEVQAFLATQVPGILYLDATLAPCVVPGGSGVTDFHNDVTISSQQISASTVLTVLDGATLHNVRGLVGNCAIQGECVTTAALSFDFAPPNTASAFTMDLVCQVGFLAGALVPMIEVPAGPNTLAVFASQGSVFNNTLAPGVPIVNLGAGAQGILGVFSTITFFGSFDQTWGGDATAILQFFGDSTALVPTTMVPLPINDVRLDQAAQAEPSVTPFPASPRVGQMCFDTTGILAIPRWWNGTDWVQSTGLV